MSRRTDGAQIDILCEDGPVIAVNKAPGLISQGAPIGTDSLVSQVKAYLKEKYSKPGNVYLGVPHRLDRPVSGVVVFSRNSKCAARLSEQFAKRQVTKQYLAVVEKPPQPAAGHWEDWIYRIPDVSRVEISSKSNPEAKIAHLDYETIACHRGRALLAIRLGTGRMHQIRIQSGSRGCPIVGDAQYGAKSFFPGQSNTDTRTAPIALHAYRLDLKHPVRYDDLSIIAPIPRSWSAFGFDRALGEWEASTASRVPSDG